MWIHPHTNRNRCCLVRYIATQVHCPALVTTLCPSSTTWRNWSKKDKWVKLLQGLWSYLGTTSGYQIRSLLFHGCALTTTSFWLIGSILTDNTCFLLCGFTWQRPLSKEQNPFLLCRSEWPPQSLGPIVVSDPPPPPGRNDPPESYRSQWLGIVRYK